MPTINASASQQITIPAGQRLRFLIGGAGTGMLSASNGADGLIQLGVSEQMIGPFPSDRVFRASCTQAVTYQLQAPPFDQYLSNGNSAVNQDASGALSNQSLQSLVLGAGNKVVLPKFQAALTAMKAGTRNAKILCLGDSTTAGLWATGVAYANNRASNYPNAMAAALASRYATYTGNQFGSAESTGSIANFKAFDPRWVMDANWSANSGFLLAGDVALVAPVPQSSGTTSLATQLGIVQEVRKAAINNGCFLIDANASYGDWAYASGTLGYYLPANDVTHPGAAGYTALGNLVANMLPL